MFPWLRFSFFSSASFIVEPGPDFIYVFLFDDNGFVL